MIRKTQHNLTLYNPYKVSQWRKNINFIKATRDIEQLGISKDLRYRTLISYFTKAIKFIELHKHAEVYNLYKQVISLLKTLGRKRIYIHYQDNVNIRSQNNTHQDVRMENGQAGLQKLAMQNNKIEELEKELERLNEDKQKLEKVLARKISEGKKLHEVIMEKDVAVDELEKIVREGGQIKQKEGKNIGTGVRKVLMNQNNENSELYQIIEELKKISIKDDEIKQGLKKIIDEQEHRIFGQEVEIEESEKENTKLRQTISEKNVKIEELQQQNTLQVYNTREETSNNNKKLNKSLKGVNRNEKRYKINEEAKGENEKTNKLKIANNLKAIILKQKEIVQKNNTRSNKIQDKMI